MFYYSQRTILSTSHSALNALLTTSWTRYYHYHYLTEKETEEISEGAMLTQAHKLCSSCLSLYAEWCQMDKCSCLHMPSNGFQLWYLCWLKRTSVNVSFAYSYNWLSPLFSFWYSENILFYPWMFFCSL